jgi:tRNA (cmo5U34)-methyltransferase
MRADKSAPLGAQLRWLEEAGFGGVECRLKDHRFAVYGGRKGRASSYGREEK